MYMNSCDSSIVIMYKYFRQIHSNIMNLNFWRIMNYDLSITGNDCGSHWFGDDTVTGFLQCTFNAELKHSHIFL